MNELLSSSGNSGNELDYVGSLVDGDMGAYYNWLNQQRLPGAEQSSFLAWFEGQGEGLAIGRDVGDPVTLDYPGERPFRFTGGTIKRVAVDVSGEAYIDLEREAQGMLMRE